MSEPPVVVIEDDPIIRLLAVVLDPNTSAERHAAFARFVAQDLPDFDTWCEGVRKSGGPLYPADVRLAHSQEEFRAALPSADAAIVESFQVGPDELALSDRLRAIQKYGTIADNIDLQACLDRGVPVLTQRRRANVATAELTIGLMLALAKKLHRVSGLISVEQLTSAGYSPTTFDRRYTPNAGWARISGFRVLYESTLGIVGLGEIGREVSVRAAAFGMRVLYYQRHQLPEDEERRGQAEYAPLERLLEQSDWVSIQLPLTSDTRSMLNAERIGQMKPGACLINTSRAEIVEREAVLEALKSGRLGGFALDPLYEEPGRADDPMLAFENVVLTPHIAAQPRFNTLKDTEEIVVRLGRALAS